MVHLDTKKCQQKIREPWSPKTSNFFTTTKCVKRTKGKSDLKKHTKCKGEGQNYDVLTPSQNVREIQRMNKI